jgi:DNA-binding XRE family transcriptional regulator
MKSIKRIIRIHRVEGFKVYCLFNNGESRVIDFDVLFKKWEVKQGDLEFSIKNSEEEFSRLQLVDGTLTWSNLKIEGEDDQQAAVAYPYDLDPIVLYENSEPDESRQLKIGMLVKQARTEAGLTQEQLAKRSGTTKHYISRVENNRTGIELSTLTKIIEGGLGKRMTINIH